LNIALFALFFFSNLLTPVIFGHHFGNILAQLLIRQARGSRWWKVYTV